MDIRLGEKIMITVKEIPLCESDVFFDLHIGYLIDDGIISDEEDIEYFSGDEYRDIIRQHMARDIDRHHLVYFIRDGEKIGACSYCTYISEDGQCFILDFWVFKDKRGGGTGHECFRELEKYTRESGAEYYRLNSTKEDSVRFWKDLGFVYDGTDEYDMPLYIKR